jgi:Replication-relaxation
MALRRLQGDLPRRRARVRLLRSGRLVDLVPVRHLDSPQEAVMKLPWRVEGARLHLPRDPHLAYIVGRMALATSMDTWPLLFDSRSAGKMGFARLQKLGLLRSFARPSQSDVAWYALAPDAAPWVADAMDCDLSDLRTVHGIARTNLIAVRARNRLWVATALTCRADGAARVVLVRPEWELRGESAHSGLVPDLQMVLQAGAGDQEREATWFVELDAGTERLAVWRAKAEAYAEAARRGALFGERAWRVLATVPRVRRARSVSAAVTAAGAGRLVWLGLQPTLEETRVLGAHLWRADELAAAPDSPPRWSLLGLETPDRDPGPQPRSAAAQGPAAPSAGGSR